MRTCAAILLIALLVVAALFLYAGYYDKDPSILTFLDRNGQLIGTIDSSYKGVRHWTPLNEIPRTIIDKTIRAEDQWFYWHCGINPFAVIKAGAENLSRGHIVRGGSTITQQLAKNFIQEKEKIILPRTLFNKSREALLALALEMKHKKNWIIEQYLNTVYYGNRAYGVTAAADVYFLKRLNELNEDEINTLIKMPKSPARQSYPKTLVRFTQKAAGRHFIEYAAETCLAKPGMVHDSAALATTLDLKLQQEIENSIRAELADRALDDPKLTAAVIVIDVNSGDLLAMVGSRDYFNAEIDGQVNSAVALRQPGSALKPFTYFAAFSKGFSPESIVPDEPFSFQAQATEDAESYTPQNFDRRYHGEMTMSTALANSYNVPAVVTLNEIGLSYYHELLRRFGITTLSKPPPHYGLSVTLGSGEVNLLELTNAYAALARGAGFLPYRIWKDADMAERKQIIPNSLQFASEVTSILSDPMARRKAFGFNEAMEIEERASAIKTGTSYDYRDNWAIGYTSLVAVGVWVGHADGTPMDPLKASTGATGAAPIWHAVMEILLRGNVPESERTIPIFSHRTTEEQIPTTQPKLFRIINPVANTTFRTHPYLPIEHQMIRAEAEAKLQQDIVLDWYLDGEHIKTTNGNKSEVWIEPVIGRHRLRAQSLQGEWQEITFKVSDEMEEL